MPEERPGTPAERPPGSSDAAPPGDAPDHTIPRHGPAPDGAVDRTIARPGSADDADAPRAGMGAPDGGRDAPSDQPATGADDSADPKGHWIAGYRIVGKLGEGGMGVVYEAEQQTPRRAVALKVIRGGAYVDEQTIRLFQREIQTLARLKHPSIAAIYEAGRTDEGQRFFAMELVRGAPLDEYVRAHSLPPDAPASDLRERLLLFLQICEAINYAHQRGVIHRDIKPSNVLVISDPSESGTATTAVTRTRALGPQVKILDFGLARITDADVNATAVLSEVGQIAGTLAYMSPEQARGNPDEIDLRTDVYSLGVVLYELLTGKPPYEIPAGQLPAALRMICEEIPQRPSTLRRVLRGDLETIVLKALEKDPAQRYQSVLALAEDVDRYLTDQPILARPPSTVYQMRKLIARHKTAFGFGVALVVLLIAFAATMSVMFGVQRTERLRADAARARAEREAQKAAQINTFLQDMLASVDPEQARGREVTVREVLDRAASDIGRDLVGQPEIQAAVRNTIGTTYLALGLLSDAEPQLRAALATRRSELGDGHPEVIASLNELGHLLNAQGSYAAAESVFTTALAQSGEAFGEEHPEVATALNNLGLAVRYQGRDAEAEPLFRESLEMRRRLLGNEARETAAGLNNLALTLYDLGRYEEAEPLYREALAIQQKVLGPEHLEVARTQNNLALLLRKTGELEEAQTLYQSALHIQQEQLGDEHPSIVVTMINLAGILRAREEYAAAEPRYDEALRMAERVLGADHPYVAAALLNLGDVRSHLGHLGPAEEAFRRAAEIYQAQLGDDHPYRATALERLGTVLSDAQRPIDAEAPLREALRVRLAAHGEDHWRTAQARNLLGHCLSTQGRFTEAESLLIGSWETLADCPEERASEQRQALERIIAHYEARGLDTQAAIYRNILRETGE